MKEKNSFDESNDDKLEKSDTSNKKLDVDNNNLNISKEAQIEIDNTNEKSENSVDLEKTIIDSNKIVGEKKIVPWSIYAKKAVLLFIAIIFMGFAQAIFNYTSPVGMAPIDSGIKSIEEANPFGWVYTQINYVVVTILVLVAILLSPKEKRLVTSSSFITGYVLAFLVTFLTRHVVNHFPGFVLGTNNEALLEHQSVYTDFDYRVWLWFLLAFFLLTFSIGMWANVDFVLRPYDIVIIRASERKNGKSYVYTRNLSDSILVLIAIGFSTLGFLINAHPEKNGYAEYLTVGVGTVLIVTCAGYVSHFWIRVFKKIF